MQIPKMIYGTAWKEDRTKDLVLQALTAGFRGIDTAAQPKHYHEKGVGDALLLAQQRGIPRKDLFLQTKFTPISGHDPKRIPYDPNAPLGEQVIQSFASSLKNLNTEYVDSLVLHSPLRNWEQMTEVWSAMESLVNLGGVRILGISNCYELKTLEALYRQAQVKPQVLQNRFYSETSYDTELRASCKEKEITYQSFWTLSANPHLLKSREIRQLAEAYQKTEPQILFRFLSQIGIVPLTGTQSEQHMKEDLAIFEFSLRDEEIQSLQHLLDTSS